MVFYTIERFVDDRIGFREVHRCQSAEDAHRIAEGLYGVFSIPHRVVTVTLEFSEPYGKTEVSSDESDI